MKRTIILSVFLCGAAWALTACDEKTEAPAAKSEQVTVSAASGHGTGDKAAGDKAAGDKLAAALSPATDCAHKAGSCEGCDKAHCDKAHCDKADCDKADCGEGCDGADCGAHAAGPDKTDTPAQGCAHGDKAGADKIGGGKAEPGKTAHYGVPFTDTPTITLGAAIKAAKDDAETPVKVSGDIAKVCKKKGCWLVIREGDVTARIVMKDYGFLVPTDSQGKKAIIEGALKVKVFDEAMAKHMAEDGGEDPNTVTGAHREYLVTATAIQIDG